MLITKFNKLIKSKIVLIALAFIIVLAFVGLPVASQMMSKNQRDRGSEGTILGNDVDSREFRMCRLFELKLRTDIKLTAEQNVYLRERVWQRIAALRYAESAGIVASNEEIAEYMKRDEAFSTNGQFDLSRYRQILYNIGISEGQYEEFMRQELVLRKLSDTIASSLWVPHSEARQRASTLMDSFIAEYVHLSASNTVAKIKVSNNEAREYFENNKEQFRIPEKINIRYVEFPADDYIADNQVAESDIETYYYDNIEDYSIVDTNNASIPKPLEEVKDDIAATISLKQALNAAAINASEMVGLMAPRRNKEGLPMTKAALAVKREIRTSGFFSSDENIPELDPIEGGARLAFSLDPEDNERYFSDAIIGESNVYVLAANERQESRLPEFSEVKNKIMPIVEEEVRNLKFYEKAKAIRDEFSEQLGKGKSFSEVAKSKKLDVVTTSEFNAYDGFSSNDVDYAYEIIPNMLYLNEGELSELIDTDDGVLIARAAKRIPSDALTIQAMKPQVTAMIERYRYSIVFEDWLAYNLKNSQFIDYREEARLQLRSEDDEIIEDDTGDTSDNDAVEQAG